ncbi:MAG: metallophosphoesterase [Candidatus Woesearchaeota archaeon]
MRIFAFTDVHGNIDALKKIKGKLEADPVDYVLCCGDITNFGKSQKSIISLIASFPSHTLMVHGNHEIPESMMEDCSSYDNITFLHSSAYRDGHFIFFGYGGDSFSVEDKNFRRISRLFSNDIKPGDKVVMVLHGPPYKALDETLSGNSGNKDYRNFIDKISPIKAFCGHIHESSGRKTIVGDTLVVNPGMDGMFFDL